MEDSTRLGVGGGGGAKKGWEPSLRATLASFTSHAPTGFRGFRGPFTLHDPLSTSAGHCETPAQT